MSEFLRARRGTAGAHRGACALLIVLLLPVAAARGQNAATAPSAPVTPAEVIAHLQTTVDWYHAVSAAAQQPQANTSATMVDRLHQGATEALQLAFEYARAQGALLHPQSSTAAAAAPDSAAGNLQQVDSRLAQRISTLEAELRDVNASLARARVPDRASLAARRDSISADLQLAHAMQASVEQILRFATAIQSDQTSPNTLTAQIDALERRVPEARHTAPAAASAAPAARAQPSSSATAAGNAPSPVAPAFQPQNAGIISLATELLTITRARRAVSELERTTDDLLQSIQQRRAPLSANVRALIRTADAASTETSGAAAGTSGALHQSVGEVQRITAALVPLAEQGIAVENVRSLLEEWRNTLGGNASSVGTYLLIRVVTLVVAVLVLLVISEVWRRATYRYLHDHHRRRQLLVLRRIVVAAGMIVIVVFGFVSQVGGLATYAGLITAGLAVALQNVILAVVAYFLLIGRYGIHAGDRVTIGGVTGRVIEIGLVRLYMMELSAPDFHPSGRIVVFSNAIIFQPSALFRQVPGVDYVWHTVTLTVASDVDLANAEHLIRSAVETAFEPFRESIERQFATLREHADVDAASGRPQVHIRVAEPGIEMLVRFPVDQARANEMDNAVMSAVRQAVEKAPGIHLAPAGAPTLQVNTPA